jgi:hypothetical protein
MLKKVTCFLFSIFFLSVLSVYAEEVAVESNDVEVSANTTEVEAEVAENVESTEKCSE